MKLLQNYTDLIHSGIYCIKNITTEKLYIGSSTNMYHRLKRHLCDLRKNRHKNPILQSSFNKHGEDSFVGFLLETCETSVLIEREQWCIDQYKPQYNVVKNVVRIIVSDDAKKRIASTLKKKYLAGMKSYDHPDKKIPISVYTLTGEYVDTYESKSEAARRLSLHKSQVTGFFSGKTKSAGGYQFREYGDDIPVTDITLLINACWKGVKVLNTKTGEELVFTSINEAEKKMNFPRNTIPKTIKSGKLYKKTYFFTKFEHERS